MFKTVGFIRGFLLCWIFCFHTVWLIAQSTVKKYPLPLSEIKSKTFHVKAGEDELFTASYKDINYVYFEQLRPIVLTVTSTSKIIEYEVNPKKNIDIEHKNNQLTVRISKPGYFVVKINKQHTLFVFAENRTAGEVKPGDKNVVNILDYDVDSFGKICETQKLQQALDDVSKNRQTLYFPPGIYKTGTLRIESNTKVFLDAGAMIKGSEKIEDYPTDSGKTEFKNFNDLHGKDNGEIMTFSRLILIDNAKNVRLWGRGIIDGNGAIIRNLGKPANLIRVRNSSNVRIEGIVLRDPAAWNTHILYSKNVEMKNVKIINDKDIRNTDGIDPDASVNIKINHCFAYCADDNIAIKSSNNSSLLQNVNNIRVKNCVFLTKKSSLKIGTETKSVEISKVIFKNNEVIEADRGIALYCYDGAIFKNIKFINNRFINGFEDLKQKAIHFEVRNRFGKGAIKNVLLKNCVFEKTFHASSQITGLSTDHSISNIKFKNTKADNNICLNAEDFNLKTNEFTRDIIFKK